MSVASGQCDAGYYCFSGARSPTPDDGGTTGDRCPEGHYCPRGSSAPLPCPIGHYSNSTRNRYPSNCLHCPPGWSKFIWHILVFCYVSCQKIKLLIQNLICQEIIHWHDVCYGLCNSLPSFSRFHL